VIIYLCVGGDYIFMCGMGGRFSRYFSTFAFLGCAAIFPIRTLLSVKNNGRSDYIFMSGMGAGSPGLSPPLPFWAVRLFYRLGNRISKGTRRFD
jgi:hypothetical protein